MKNNTAENKNEFKANDKQQTEKTKKSFKRPKDKKQVEKVDYLVETPQDAVVEKEYQTILSPELKPENWDMMTDALVALHQEIKYLEEVPVIRNTGLKSYTNEPIGESSVEEKLIKSSIRFATVVSAGKSTNVKPGDVVSIGMQSVKLIDFDKNYAVVPHFAIYGKVGGPKESQSVKPARTNLFGRIIKGWGKWLGSRNVLKQK
jgi:hypothetical protein